MIKNEAKRKNVLVVFTTDLEFQWNAVGEDVYLRRMYMGFGYNPNLESSGERLDMLDFFAWMKRLQDEGVRECTIWDASGYSVINRLPYKRVRGKMSAKELLVVVVDEQEGKGYGDGKRKQKIEEIRINCDLRAAYLKSLLEISGVNDKYIDSREVFRQDAGRFSESLEIALEYFDKLDTDNPVLRDNLKTRNQNPASWLYVPFEIAEALYLQKTLETQAKFGPETEQFFDEAILDLQKRQGIPFTSIWCPVGPRRAAYLADERVITTRTIDDYIQTLLEDTEYRKYVEGYLSPFRQDGETLAGCAIRMKNLLKGAL